MHNIRYAIYIENKIFIIYYFSECYNLFYFIVQLNQPKSNMQI